MNHLWMGLMVNYHVENQNCWTWLILQALQLVIDFPMLNEGSNNSEKEKVEK